jgi:hydrogenase-1 operon protein HyaE
MNPTLLPEAANLSPQLKLAVTALAGAHPLIVRLAGSPGAMPVDLATLDDWLQAEGNQVLFFGGDPVRFPECLDVAVVLPELAIHFRDRFAIGVVSRTDEDAIAARFGVQRWPSLVFLRGGQHVAIVAGMKDWDDFVAEVAAALAKPASKTPTRVIPLIGAEPVGACH